MGKDQSKPNSARDSRILFDESALKKDINSGSVTERATISTDVPEKKDDLKKILAFRNRLQLGMDKKRFEGDIAPIRAKLLAGEQLQTDSRQAVEEFFKPMVTDDKVLFLIHAAFWTMPNDHQAQLLVDYEALRAFAEPLAKKLENQEENRQQFMVAITSEERGETIRLLSSLVGEILKKESEIDPDQKLKDEVEAKLRESDFSGLTDYESFCVLVLGIKEQVLVERSLRSAKINRATKSWVCGRKHRIVLYKGGKKRIEKSAASGQTEIQFDTREMASCAHCTVDFKRSEKGYASCLQGCDMYMCSGCSQCAKQHILTWQVGMPQKYKDMNCSHAYCDKCGHTFSNTELQAGFHRCAKCDYDICVNCISTPKLVNQNN